MNWFLDPIKNAVNDILTGILHDYNQFLMERVFDLLNEVSNTLTNTPSILDNTVLKIILSFTTNIAMLLTAVGFVISLKMALVGHLSGGNTIRKALFRFVVTIILVGSAGDLCLKIIEFADDMVVSAHIKISTEIAGDIFKSTLIYGSASMTDKIAEIGSSYIRELASVIQGLTITTACFVLWALGIFRVIQLSYYVAIAPLMLACNIMEITRGITVAFFKEFIFISLKSFFYFIILAFYIGLFAIGDLSYALNSFLWYPIYMILLIIALFKLPKKTGELIGVNDSGFNLSGAIHTAVSVVKYAV